MKKLRRVTILILTLLICFAFVPAAFAHPLGNFTINQYAGLSISRERVLVDYVLDMAEIPAFQEIAKFDTNGNGHPDSSEAAFYHAGACASLRPDLRLSLNNQPVDLTLGASSVEFPAGVGGLPTLRLTCQFEAALDFTESNHVLSFTNEAFADRLGWKEIVVFADGVSLQGEYATTSPSNRLTIYPEDLLTSPLDQREVEFEITSIALPTQNESSYGFAETSSPLADRNDAFTRLILLEEITLPTLLLAFIISFVWGAMHAMTPGHGKTIVGAYLVGSRGTIKHALYLGLTTTITHTLGVFALGLITLFAAQYIVPEMLYPWMSLLSGLFVVGIGLNLFTGRLRSSGLVTWIHGLKTKLSGRAAQAYSPALVHAHSEVQTHQHKYVVNTSHEHTHGTHSHSHADRDHGHTHDGHHHDHDRTDHSHLPPGADGSPVTWRSLLALGISGGLLPCPSALVVLLGAIALNKIGFGLILVLAFSLGLAGALTAIGMMFIYAGKFFQRFPSQGKLITLLPALSALFISVIGFAICIKALAEIGFF
ncbi:MAG TPA: sulfite exporter TauE/SafE family protein [Anaerolineales bacterium]|nr:sulfite exporter TauE/SafE family protein [Anaerolineales bacterium]